ncbi:MAG: hypothetical protein L0Y80_12115 [Ignavibacteriae bacterium]|nr:hypothetical protein [Ignavibacteriota bacterium]
MKLFRLTLLFSTLSLFAGAQIANAQDDIGSQLSKVSGENAPNYLSPFLSGLGADLNSGIYHSADLHSVLGFDIGVKFTSILVQDDDKMFDFVMPDQIQTIFGTLQAGQDYDKIISGSPTLLGGETGIDVKVKDTSPNVPARGQTIFSTPPGSNLKLVPLIVPQASVGLPFGIEVTGRFIPTVSLGDVGKVNFLGFGLRHDIDQYIPVPLPIDIAAHFMTQSLTFSDKDDKKILSGSGTAFGLEVSASALIFTLYGGLQLESSSWDIESYEYTDESSGTPVTVQIPGFSVDGKNKSRFHAGVRFILAVINIHADYSFANQPVITAGLGISFR